MAQARERGDNGDAIEHIMRDSLKYAMTDLPPVNISQYLLPLLLSICFEDVRVDPGDNMVFEDALNYLMEDVRR